MELVDILLSHLRRGDQGKDKVLIINNSDKTCLFHREKIADAMNNGSKCESSRNLIPLAEMNTCNNVDCLYGENYPLYSRIARAPNVVVMCPIYIRVSPILGINTERA